VEFYRIPDAQYGYFFGFITMGQILCLPMLLLGIVLLYLSKKWQNNPHYDTVRLQDGSNIRVKRYHKK
jgi:prolipoprotein diacylglyceryltransferase